ncbi:MAG: glutamate formimidoyltransferase [Clostridia bacterium]|nr:glutamate formimidoyltransferase [Clostridia bacterium]
MAKLIECIPNISEGVNMELVERMLKVVTDEGVRLLNHSSDPKHNRSVITFVGTPEQVEEAAVALAKAAAKEIDLTKHTGEHPRMGALDVCPFVPIKEVTIEETKEVALRVAERIAKEADVPVFLYEESASAPHRRNLPKIRNDVQFEGMAEKVLLDDWHPDFGGNRIHPTAGVTAVGVRAPLVAYNINLSTDDVSIAKRIANVIREAKGGFKCVKAMGFGVEVDGKQVAQVSINMTDFTQTPLYRVFETVKMEAERYGVHVIGSEIVGLTPMNALIDSAMYYLKLENREGHDTYFDKNGQVLENYLM